MRSAQVSVHRMICPGGAGDCGDCGGVCVCVCVCDVCVCGEWTWEINSVR